ncbi:hypothetical protein FF38_14091 [Lucilia cuprina]|uniref:Uncharacterized protein n=1 Tax=Lucilia cuprina TaxID=7375 RepID=A0A0L0BMS0_LUCCU|nr:uncharacterized protein LOC111684805 isoform X1 [Lucilia cuprina]KNC21233.1 hypothetical protein FF38_14091 [Lucilia cuprina]
MDLKTKLFCLIIPIYTLLVVDELLYTEAFLKSVRIDEIPFALSLKNHNRTSDSSSLRHPVQDDTKNIYAMKRLDQHKSFLKIFNIPYIICFFAAKGKWPFIPPFMQNRVDAAARTLFSQNDSFIKQFCQKWIQIKECFRPLFSPTTTVSSLDVVTVPNQRCQCANLVATDAPVPVVYFDRDHIGNISVETISNTIEFLQNFLPPPTKKGKRKNRVRSRVDEMEIE